MAKGIAPAAAIAAWFVAAATLLGAGSASAASLVEISGFGQNPTNLRMHVYAPDTVLTVSGQTVTARNASHNGTVAAGGNTAFGFQVSRPNGNTQVPSGYACSSP